MSFHRGGTPAVSGIFRDYLDGKHFNTLHAQHQAAKQQIEDQQYDLAGAAYRNLIAAKPNNWVILHEAARLLFDGLRRNAQALTFVKTALSLNPYGAPFLWHTLGDILSSLERFGQALSAYNRACEY